MQHDGAGEGQYQIDYTDIYQLYRPFEIIWT
jgi:hypothetical protein